MKTYKNVTVSKGILYSIEYDEVNNKIKKAKMTSMIATSTNIGKYIVSRQVIIYNAKFNILVLPEMKNILCIYDVTSKEELDEEKFLMRLAKNYKKSVKNDIVNCTKVKNDGKMYVYVQSITGEIVIADMDGNILAETTNEYKGVKIKMNSLNSFCY